MDKQKEQTVMEWVRSKEGREAISCVLFVLIGFVGGYFWNYSADPDTIQARFTPPNTLEVQCMHGDTVGGSGKIVLTQ